MVAASFALFSLSATAADKVIEETAVAAGSFRTSVTAMQTAGFADDVDFHSDPPGTMQVRSASQVDHPDFDVNRMRVVLS